MQRISESRAAISALCRADEAACVRRLLPRAALPRDGEMRAEALATRLVETVRRQRRDAGRGLGIADIHAPDSGVGVGRAQQIGVQLTRQIGVIDEPPAALQMAGVFIAPDRLANIFDSFEQADAGTTRKYGGTGLGLSTAKRIVEEHGGTIGVHSDAGRGTDICISLPVDPPMPQSAD